MSNLYNLRAIAHFHLGNLTLHKEDVEEAVHLQKINIIPIINVPSLFFQRYTHVEAEHLLSLLVYYLSREGRPIEDRVFSYYILKSLKKYIKKERPIPHRPLDKILKMLKFSKTEAMKTLVRYHYDVDLKSEFEKRKLHLSHKLHDEFKKRSRKREEGNSSIEFIVVLFSKESNENLQENLSLHKKEERKYTPFKRIAS